MTVVTYSKGLQLTMQAADALAKEGIKWEKGDTVPVYDPATGQVTNIEDIPDEIKLEIDHFNKLVVTENFNRTVARELVKYLDPDGEEKTLIFATTDDHADMVVRVLQEEFEASQAGKKQMPKDKDYEYQELESLPEHQNGLGQDQIPF